MTLTVTSRPLYLGLLAVFIANVLLFTFTRATPDLSQVHLTLQWTLAFGLMFFCISRAIRRPGRVVSSFKYIFEAMMFSTLVSLSLPLLNHLTMTIPFPYQDNWLNGWDLALGLNWLAYFELVHSSPLAITVLQFCYDQLSLLGMVAMIVLIIMGDTRRVRYFMEVFFATAVLCIVVGAAFPALAAVDMYVADLSVYGNFGNPPGVYHLPHMEALRDPAGAIALNPVGLPGLVTFPSYHTASAILLGVAFWRTWAFVPAAVYGALVIASSPVFGGHYFIDLFAGTAVALAMAWLLARRPQYQGLFARRDQPAKRAAQTPQPA